MNDLLPIMVGLIGEENCKWTGVILICASQPIEAGQLSLSGALVAGGLSSCRQPRTATSRSGGHVPLCLPGSGSSNTTRKAIGHVRALLVGGSSSSSEIKAPINGGARRRAVLLLLVRRRRRYEQEDGWLLQGGPTAVLGGELRHQDSGRLLLAGLEASGASHELQRGEAEGGVRRRGSAAGAGQEQEAGIPQSLHSDPLRPDGEPDAGRDGAPHEQRAGAELADDAAEGRRGGRVEGGGGRRRRGDAARALLRQRRQPAAGAGGGIQILRLLQGAAAGPHGGGSRRRRAVRRAAGADGRQGVGALPLQRPQVQPGGVLGPAGGGHGHRQEEEEPAAGSGRAAGPTAERNRHGRQQEEDEATQQQSPVAVGDHLQRPRRTSPPVNYIPS